MSAETPPYPAPGDVLDDKYEIREVLGAGAMGAVVRARHRLRQAPVALKFMSPDVLHKPDVVERFLNEGVAASKIDSEHVVKVYDVSKLPSGQPYLVMEFLEGADLAAILQREGAAGLVDVSRAVHFALQMLRGLQVAHRAGIVHRDMKPANCFVIGKEGDQDFLKIVDFGISKVKKDDDDEGIALTQAGSALGTPLYMSPEQARSPKDVDPRSDLWGVAAITYELLCGQPPFVPESGTLSELFVMLGVEDPPDLDARRAGLPEGLWEAVHRGLEKDPDDRYQSAEAFAEALVPFADVRSDYVTAKLLRTTHGGIRLTATARRTRGAEGARDARGGLEQVSMQGTLLMDGPGSDPAVSDPTADGDPNALRENTVNVGPITLPPSGPLPVGAVVAPGGGGGVASDTAQGTVRATLAETQNQRSTPLVYAIAVVAVAATAAAAWALGQATAPSVATEPPATPDEAPPTSAEPAVERSGRDDPPTSTASTGSDEDATPALDATTSAPVDSGGDAPLRPPGPRPPGPRVKPPSPAPRPPPPALENRSDSGIDS
ncbi:MAG: serine/threonine-protein kinase [Myxococcota bacterium]